MLRSVALSHAPSPVFPLCLSTGARSPLLIPLVSLRSSDSSFPCLLISSPSSSLALQIINFGMSTSFQTVNFNQLTWPAQLLADYVRVYQRSDGKIGCDPSDRSTADYISRRMNAYSNPNLTTWERAGYTLPVSRSEGEGIGVR
jgi:hypothetical protein